MASHLNADHEAPLAEINVTPLVDVMLVLLVIFIVLAPLFAQALKVDLPKVDAPALAEPTLIDVVVHSNQRIEIGKVTVSLPQLEPVLRQQLKAEPEAVVRLGADTSVNYGVVAEVLAHIQNAGGNRLAFATKSAGESATPAMP